MRGFPLRSALARFAKCAYHETAERPATGKRLIRAQLPTQDGEQPAVIAEKPKHRY